MWEAIATGVGIARWFAPFVSVEEGEGGRVAVAWVEGADWPSRIAVCEPGRHLRLADLSDPEAAAAGTALTVDYHLSTVFESPPPGTGVSAPGAAARGHEGSDGRTRLQLVNSGLPGTPDWDEHFHMMTNGWRFFLWNLKHAVERHPGIPRRMIGARPWVTGSREEVWGRLFGVEGVVEVGWVGVGWAGARSCKRVGIFTLPAASMRPRSQRATRSTSYSTAGRCFPGPSCSRIGRGRSRAWWNRSTTAFCTSRWRGAGRGGRWGCGCRRTGWRRGGVTVWVRRWMGRSAGCFGGRGGVGVYGLVK